MAAPLSVCCMNAAESIFGYCSFSHNVIICHSTHTQMSLAFARCIPLAHVDNRLTFYGHRHTQKSVTGDWNAWQWQIETEREGLEKLDV